MNLLLAFLLSAPVLTFSLPTMAADVELQAKPANEYCFVWVGNEKGEFMDRKEIRFRLDIRSEATRNINKKFVVDQYVRASINGNPGGYRLSIFKKGQEDRPLGSGFYIRSGIIEDWNTTGFEVNTDTASYSIACITESYIE